ncbi:LPS-assembly lipoprotein LptE [Pseudomonas sp. KNUC1026]|uniref:LPS-assembly lipoprotein LptE n=1 Tax=Pseudomonas sp. KNUC1026 TaxID=2893890 RepID=UPI001F2CA823|nr:LPS assembly lipoprotein LptE [Pseudomonas sp. KNUC1026]UFH49760.1 LPS assembly lipoprotein LptE [Pseudomonas sp. KNUC1026]
MIKRNLLVIGLATVLGGCGFHLRGTQVDAMSIKEMDFSARDAYGPLTKDMRALLERSGVRIVGGAPYKLVLGRQEETRRNASYNGSARSSEVELTTTVYYQIVGRRDRVLIDDHMDVQKIYVQDSSNLAGSDEEARQTRIEMRRDLEQRLMLRLAQLQPAQLDELQAKADARAEADAAAAAEAQRVQDNTPQQSPVELPPAR